MVSPRVLVAATLAVLSSAPTAAATVDLTAHRIRVGAHPALVRVVVDFTDGTFGPNDVDLVQGSIDHTGAARIDLHRPNAQAQAAAVSRHGIRVSVVQIAGAAGLRVRLLAPPRRFKFVGYTVLHHPERLVIDVYRRSALVAAARGGCFDIRSTTAAPGTVSARGTVLERIFENSFRLRLRRADGQVVSARSVIFPPGPWAGTVRHGLAQRQRGLFEVIEFSAKDGSLECLAQTPVTLVP